MPARRTSTASDLITKNKLPHFDDFFCELDDLHLGKEIGTGQFGSVHIGTYFGDLVAVKKQYRKEEELESYLLNELAILKFAHHENLLEYIGACNHSSESEEGKIDKDYTLYIVTEFAPVS
jgi:serine/threonine protein kinase